METSGSFHGRERSESNGKLKIRKCQDGDLKCQAKLVLDAFFNPLAFLLVTTGEKVVEIVDEVKKEAEEVGKRILVFMFVGAVLYFAWKKG